MNIGLVPGCPLGRLLVRLAAVAVVALLPAVAAAQNTVTVGDASGVSGESATVSIALANEVAVKGLQVDLSWDSGVARFTDVVAVVRTTGMAVAGEEIGDGQARIVLYFDDGNALAAGSGAVADLTFALRGLGGETAVAPLNLILSDPDGDPLVVGGESGLLTVEPPTTPPDLQITVHKNPGRVRSLQIMVCVFNGSGSAPTVAAAGTPLVMTDLGGGVYRGAYGAASGATSVDITASDENEHGTGTELLTVDFQ